ncbi:phosphoenolpyruvate carboxylase [Mycobacteroides chelonae]|nr:phosphoenolpyruvate carboxylase [Mycobacteroides chelonae]
MGIVASPRILGGWLRLPILHRSEIDRAELAELFDGIDIHQAIPVIRAFTHFALLANVAEDIHRERRRAVHVTAGAAPQDSTLAATYLKLDAARLDSASVADTLTGALVSPVIAAKYAEPRTAHRNLETLLAAILESACARSPGCWHGVSLG